MTDRLHNRYDTGGVRMSISLAHSNPQQLEDSQLFISCIIYYKLRMATDCGCKI